MSEPKVIPKNLRYNNKLQSAHSKSYSSYIAPQNGTSYKNGETILINIPTGRNLALCASESVVKFTFVGANGATNNAFMRLDKAGASGLISRLRVYHGTHLLEDITNYSNLVAQMTVLQKSSACGKDSILSGFSANHFCDVQDATDVTTKTNRVVNNICGERLTKAGEASDLTTFSTIGDKTEARTYCITLLSIMGSLSDRYVPLFAMSSAPIRIEIQLHNEPAMFLCSEKLVSSYTLENVEYIAQIMELGDEAMQIITKNTSGPLQWTIPAYSNFQNTIRLETGPTQVNIPIPAKYNSLKSLFMTFREHANGTLKMFPFASHHYNLQEYNFRVGTVVVPAKNPSSIAEYWTEVLKAIGSVSDINLETSIDIDNYSAEIPAENTENNVCIKGTTTSPSFMVALDLENYANADKSDLFAGWNTTTADIFWQGKYGSNTAAHNIIVDSYALYDAVIVCENGTAELRF